MAVTDPRTKFEVYGHTFPKTVGELVRDWIQEPERTQEEVMIGIRYITKGNMDNDINVELITPELLRKLHDCCKDEEDIEEDFEDGLQGELRLEFIPDEDGKVKIHTTLTDLHTGESLYETTSSLLNPIPVNEFIEKNYKILK